MAIAMQQPSHAPLLPPQGLMNQHYSHVAALALAVVLHANVVVPPALSRNSFDAYFSMDPSKNKVTWAAAATSTMWDTAHLHAYWKGNAPRGPAHNHSKIFQNSANSNAYWEG